ncbi:MAG: TlpA disulfide reductase family protein [Owenweeksia sp.]|nr:TlpA disulfide reductase family protein [Owenweeksia sp.]
MNNSQVREGIWRGTISLNDSIDLPFNFKLTHQDSGYKVVIHNAEEEIVITDITLQNDSLKIQMPVFASYLLVQPEAEQMKGMYIRPDAKDYRLPFKAVYGDTSRFAAKADKCCDINEKWRVKLSPGTEDEDPAIAYFKQQGKRVTGSFVTPYGDFRYLEGSISGDSLFLSSYDGNNLYYFEAQVMDGQMIKGLRYWGRSFAEPWIAFRDEDFALPDADTLTHLKEGFEGISFRYPSLEGDTLSLQDFAGQPVIITIMGSWCPNCMDEARYLTDLHRQYHDDGLAIVGLTFERVKDRKTALARARKMKRGHWHNLPRIAGRSNP